MGTSPGDVGRSPNDSTNQNQGMYTSLDHQPQGSKNPEIPKLINPMTKLTFPIPCPSQVDILPQVAQLHLKMYDCPDQVGGPLNFFLRNWRKITNDPWILEVITGSLIVDTNTVIWILQHLGFVINWKKISASPSTTTGVSGVQYKLIRINPGIAGGQEGQNSGQLSSIDTEASRLSSSFITGNRAVESISAGSVTSSFAFSSIANAEIESKLLGSQNYGTMIELTESCFQELKWWMWEYHINAL